MSLIELMIALLLGGLIIAAVGTVYIGSRQSFRTQDSLARLQEGARFAFETMAVDIRQTGLGCEHVNPAVPDETSAGWFTNLFTRSLRGYDQTTDIVDDEIADTDAFWALRADKSREVLITAPGVTDDDVPVDAGGLFVVTEGYSDATVYSAATVGGTSYTKAESSLCQGTAVPDTANYRLAPLLGHFYYIRENPAEQPSLYRETLLADGSTEAQELVEGVEDMQILYGEDTSQATVAECPDDNCSVDAYVDADTVTNWNRVVAVRVTLTLRTTEDNLATEDSAAGDRRIRKSFTTTIAVRNRL
jgi:type IV pilus assembly protein PilW